MPTALDHVLVLLLCVALPAHDVLFWWPRLRAATGTRLTRLRMRSYRQTMAVEWGLTAAVAAHWAWGGRGWPDLGLGFDPGLGFWTALALFGTVAAFFSWQRLHLESEEEGRAEVARQMGGLQPLLPHTRTELRSFLAVAVTAGICEEILFRGFLLWYLALLVPGWAALVVGAVLFGMAHAYQGPRGIVQTTVVGLVMGILYWFSGSLWVPILLHAFIDVNSGLLAYAILADKPAPFPGDEA